MKALPVLLLLGLLVSCQAPAPTPLPRFSNDFGWGTAVPVGETPSTWILATARHVAVHDGPEVDGVPARIIARDPFRDLVLVEVPKRGQEYRVLSLTNAEVGQQASAKGWIRPHTRGLPVPVRQTGHISYVSDDLLLWNGGLAPGMSGGALLDSRGRVLGISVAVSPQWGLPWGHLSIFVPSSAIKELLDAYT